MPGVNVGRLPVLVPGGACSNFVDAARCLTDSGPASIEVKFDQFRVNLAADGPTLVEMPDLAPLGVNQVWATPGGFGKVSPDSAKAANRTCLYRPSLSFARANSIRSQPIRASSSEKMKMNSAKMQTMLTGQCGGGGPKSVEVDAQDAHRAAWRGLTKSC